ncbi:MAG: TlpA family protein disulfide reductase [Planctomycetes bacterium]|nr:TlpA family protein disulfide reductase [Planctomycetota bacterium]
MSNCKLIALTCLAAIITFASDAYAQDDQVDVIALIKEIRQSEQWFSQVSSLQVQLNETTIRTSQGIAKERDRLGKLYPSRKEFDPAIYTGLQPQEYEQKQFMFSPDRILYESRRTDGRYSLSFWDGIQEITASGSDSDQITSYIFSDKSGRAAGQRVLNNMIWPQAAVQSYWWRQIDTQRATEMRMGSINDFKLSGRKDFRGIDCYELETRSGFIKWYVGVEDHLLHGIVARRLKDNNSEKQVILDIAKRRGQNFKSTNEYYMWKFKQAHDVRSEIDREYYAALISDTRPVAEIFMLDYKQIEPGKWFPMTQGAQWYLKEPDENGKYILKETRTLSINQIKLNQPLQDNLFEIDLIEGVEVNDMRFDVPLSYPYEHNMPIEKWDAILTDARKNFGRQDKWDENRNELIGKVAPEFPKSKWLNSKALSLKELRGKVVILEFWSISCVPCRTVMPEMNELHKKRDETGIVVIGIHTASKDFKSIKEFAKRYNLQYPIYIDTEKASFMPSWGRIFGNYGIYGIPQTFVIDRKGVIAGQGELDEVVRIAKGLLN